MARKPREAIFKKHQKSRVVTKKKFDTPCHGPSLCHFGGTRLMLCVARAGSRAGFAFTWASEDQVLESSSCSTPRWGIMTPCLNSQHIYTNKSWGCAGERACGWVCCMCVCACVQTCSAFLRIFCYQSRVSMSPRQPKLVTGAVLHGYQVVINTMCVSVY